MRLKYFFSRVNWQETFFWYNIFYSFILNNKIIDNISNFLKDILIGIGELKSFGSNLIQDVSVSITSALSFSNISLNIFGCELTPSCPSSDYFSIQNGSGALESGQNPRFGQIDNVAQNPNMIIDTQPAKPFASPDRSTNDLPPIAP